MYIEKCIKKTTRDSKRNECLRQQRRDGKGLCVKEEHLEKEAKRNLRIVNDVDSNYGVLKGIR